MTCRNPVTHYENELREWVENKTNPFTIAEALEFLEINASTELMDYLAVPIEQALANLGCVKAGNLYTKHPKIISRDELIT